MGTSGTVDQSFFATNTISTQWIVAVRLLFAGTLLIGWCLVTEPHQLTILLQQPKQILQVILFGFFGVLPSQFTYFMAIRTGNAPTATILQFLSPLFILAYFAIHNWQLPRRLDLISVSLALLGTYLLVTHGQLTQLSLSPAALMWGGFGDCCGFVHPAPWKIITNLRCKISHGACDVCGWLSNTPDLNTDTATDTFFQKLGRVGFYRHRRYDVFLFVLYPKPPLHFTEPH